MILIWDEYNLAHIAKHAVNQDEVAQVIQSVRRPFPQKIGHDRFRVHGQATAGRYLQVIYVIRHSATIDVAMLSLEDRIAVEAGELIGYVIHARDLEHGEKQTLRKRR